MVADSLLIQHSHNRFPADTAFPQVDVISDGFKELCGIIAKYDVQSCFRLRLLHRHTMLSEGEILLGTSTTQPLGYWTEPTPILDIERHKIHGHIFSVDTRTSEGKELVVLIPSEFHEGPLVGFDNIDSNFFTEIVGCLWLRGLQNTLGLEAIQGQARKMVEFSFDTGSLLVEENYVRADLMDERRGQFTFQETGWTVTVTDDGLVDTTGETRCVVTGGTHLKVTNTQVKNVSDAIKILEDECLLAM